MFSMPEGRGCAGESRTDREGISSERGPLESDDSLRAGCGAWAEYGEYRTEFPRSRGAGEADMGCS